VRHESARGVLSALACFLTWGLVPLFWKQLHGIGTVELIAHRLVWSVAVLAAIAAFRPGGFGPVRAALSSRAATGRSLVSGGLLGTNWLAYVWAVDHGCVIDASLGYFMVPLVNVAFGSLILRERLRPAQWLAIACAAAGVGVMVLGAGGLPWISLVLATSWGLYGLMRKQAALGAFDGLMLEAILYSPLAVAYLVWLQHAGTAALGHVGLVQHVFLLSTGWITAIPLVLFAYGARRIRLTTLGLLQYVTPSIQFFLGLLLYHEPFDAARFRACACIWCALAIYSADSLWSQRPRQAPPMPPGIPRPGSPIP
jgi:chloramphenicol-sensitive protein RarD